LLESPGLAIRWCEKPLRAGRLGVLGDHRCVLHAAGIVALYALPRPLKLTNFPFHNLALALGPMLEHLQMLGGTLYQIRLVPPCEPGKAAYSFQDGSP
jgi:hypothetical protein